jgi:predicted cobalt transporter CbtA
MEIARRTLKTRQKSLILGLAGFASISAIEGVSLSPESHRMFAEFDAKGMTAQERRKAIALKHAKKA